MPRTSVALLLRATQALAPSVSAPATAIAGEAVEIQYFAPTGSSSQDWISIYAIGAANTSYGSWRYITGDGAGSVILTAPSTPGIYEARYLLNNGYVDAARSGLIAVSVPIPVNSPPVWDMTDVIFQQGVPAELDLRTRASDADGDPLTFNVVTGLRPDIVGAFSFNDFKVFYDGRDLGLAEGDPPLIIDSGITISADDGRA